MSKITGGGSADGRSRAEASAVYGYDIMIRMGKSQGFLKGEETVVIGQIVSGGVRRTE